MTGFAVQYDLHEIDGIADVFNRLAADDQEELKESIGQQVVSQTRWRFENEEDPDGNAWIPSQRAEAEGGKTLQDRGHLRDSVVYEVLATAILIGSNLVYAAIHQWGGVANDFTALDARTYLGINDDNAHDIEQTALDYYGAFIA